MICHLCGFSHPGHCKNLVKEFAQKIEELNKEITNLRKELESNKCLTKSNASLTNDNLSNIVTNECLTKSNRFDKKSYQREYMRRRRAK